MDGIYCIKKNNEVIYENITNEKEVDKMLCSNEEVMKCKGILGNSLQKKEKRSFK